MKTLISVLNYNNFLATKKCINSILSIPQKNLKIFIVDNNSSDNSFLKLKSEFPSLKIYKSNYNGGYAAGHKNAVSYALKNEFDFIWILNNDLTIRKNTLESLLSGARKYGLGLYGSITLKSESPDVINFGGGLTNDISKPFNYNSFENYSLKEYLKTIKLRPVQSIEGSSFLISTEIIIKHGFMREDFFMYGEEIDYCYRLNKLGIKSYIVPTSVVIHKGAESLKKKRYLEKYYRRRNFLFFEKDHYGVSILKNISIKSGIINSIKFFITFYIKFKTKDNLYYLNLANFHALINKKGKLK
jgi:GT2 family glycosyltransferase